MGGTTFEINTGFSAGIGDGAAIYANASCLVGIGEHADGPMPIASSIASSPSSRN
ncbi:hypothetical protein APY04_0391 [Hyphomicrobium sulfonivorans]|uniref:Uncharacterized protein n=1 Tax=Hyphomicrobium sulfonivorans TaxID=121290 RepID=A0A125NW20_HYPSL|nr:hypothetical protein [Hyphomicrobium sulfonivorans]KWT71595.1 hypothetical protein APY04_0391 [Hyphomicrobium sulfonivorans]